ncbi:Uncharacterised protein [Mycobacterium tuberculosis]|nr:Uncharacterised protein [Mycobacterium tuberculosis]
MICGLPSGVGIPVVMPASAATTRSIPGRLPCGPLPP